MQQLLAGSVAGAAACTATYPLESLRWRKLLRPAVTCCCAWLVVPPCHCACPAPAALPEAQGQLRGGSEGVGPVACWVPDPLIIRKRFVWIHAGPRSRWCRASRPAIGASCGAWWQVRGEAGRAGQGERGGKTTHRVLSSPPVSQSLGWVGNSNGNRAAARPPLAVHNDPCSRCTRLTPPPARRPPLCRRTRAGRAVPGLLCGAGQGFCQQCARLCVVRGTALRRCSPGPHAPMCAAVFITAATISSAHFSPMAPLPAPTPPCSSSAAGISATWASTRRRVPRACWVAPPPLPRWPPRCLWRT